MNDVVYRQSAIDTVEKYDFNFPEYMERFVTELRDAMKEDLKGDIADLPSAQKKGRWVHDGYDFPGGVDWIHCSECGKRGINVPADLSNFCPNCGADMRGENELRKRIG